MLENMQLFQGAAERMRYSSERHKLITANIANADTPNYQGKDLRPFTLDSDKIPLSQSSTREKHLNFNERNDKFAHLREAMRSPVYEETIDGNRVSLEEETAKAADAVAGHSLANAVWSKSLTLFGLAIGRNR